MWWETSWNFLLHLFFSVMKMKNFNGLFLLLQHTDNQRTSVSISTNKLLTTFCHFYSPQKRIFHVEHRASSLYSNSSYKLELGTSTFSFVSVTKECVKRYSILSLIFFFFYFTSVQFLLLEHWICKKMCDYKLRTFLKKKLPLRIANEIFFDVNDWGKEEQKLPPQFFSLKR